MEAAENIPTEDVVEVTTAGINKHSMIVIVGSTAVLAAAGIGYFFYRRNKRKKDLFMNDEIIETFHYIQGEPVYTEGDGISLESEAITLEPQILEASKLVQEIPNLNRATNPKVDYNGMSKRVTPPIPEEAWHNPPTLEHVNETVVEEPMVRNVFAASDDDWDYELELQNRHPQKPYVIHADEFAEDNMGCRQISLTYYAGDDVMIDSYDNEVHDYAKTLGELKFNHGSKDPSVVYIRNEAQMTEYEVIAVPGQYALEVLGQQAEEELENELRHSHAVPRMRRE